MKINIKNPARKLAITATVAAIFAVPMLLIMFSPMAIVYSFVATGLFWLLNAFLPFGVAMLAAMFSSYLLFVAATGVVVYCLSKKYFIERAATIS